MFFKKKSYIDKVREKTRQGKLRSARTAIYEVQCSIERACEEGKSSTKVTYYSGDQERVEFISQYLSEQGFKTSIDKGSTYVTLKISW